MPRPKVITKIKSSTFFSSDGVTMFATSDPTSDPLDRQRITMVVRLVAENGEIQTNPVVYIADKNLEVEILNA